MRHLLLGLALACAATDAAAQCSDGSPPPCAAQRRVDPSRVVVLPFRVVAADTLLGEGFAELLSTEFTGVDAPRAIDMATVLAAWRRAGGSARRPLSAATAVELARSVGAGLLVQGSIVGIGTDLNVSARVHTVPSGESRSDAVKVKVPRDSVDASLRQTAVQLLASVGDADAASVREGARFTSSPPALRHYLRGLALWRRGLLNASATAFDEAIALDSTFAPAILRRYVAQRWGVPGRISDSLMFAHRTRLPARDRDIVRVLIGDSFPPANTNLEILHRADSIARHSADWPEMSFIAGDYWMHWGTFVDPVHDLERAREYMLRAAAVEDRSTYHGHLLITDLLLGDTAGLRRTLARWRPDPLHWTTAIAAAARLRDNALLARLTPLVDSTSFPGSITVTIAAPVPARVDSLLYFRMRSVMPTPAARDRLDHSRALALLAHQRYREAAALGATLSAAARAELDRWRVAMALSGETVPDVAAAVERLSASRFPRDRCTADLWRVEHGDTTVAATTFDAATTVCAWSIALLRATSGAGGGRTETLLQADARLKQLIDHDQLWAAPWLLARAWERAGDPVRALATIRYRFRSTTLSSLPWNYAEEGRLAELAGDTAGAIRAYGAYLEVTALGDSPSERRARVQAALARLARVP